LKPNVDKNITMAPFRTFFSVQIRVWVGNNPHVYERLTTAWIKCYVFICCVNQIDCRWKEMSGMNGLGDGGVEWNGRVEGYWARLVLWGIYSTASTSWILPVLSAFIVYTGSISPHLLVSCMQGPLPGIHW